MPLRHLRLPQLAAYSHGARVQESLVKKFLLAKASGTTLPDPTVITAEFKPVYTCGRREVGGISDEQKNFLRANGRAEFVEAMRGGQTTFHGPGQLVAYPIVDLRTYNISPREYVCVLQKALIQTCGRFGINAFTTENTGVWTTQDDKIAAIGVHMRRNITSHGIGLNVNIDLWWFNRIVACGLEGKFATNFEKEGIADKTVGEVGDVFVEEFGKQIGIQTIKLETELV